MRPDDRDMFLQMLNECYELHEAIDSKGELYSRVVINGTNTPTAKNDQIASDIQWE